MKIFIFFMCLLGVIYAVTCNPKETCNLKEICKPKETCNPKEFETICQTLKDCANKTSNCGNSQCPLISIDAWICAMEKAGVIKNNTLNREELIEHCKVIFTRKEDVCCCEKVVKECLDEGCKDLGCNPDEIRCVGACIIRKGLFTRICCGK